jgi:hypothetical protein
MGKNLSDMFTIQNGLKQEALSPLIFNFAIEHATKEGPRKPGRAEYEWDTSAFSLCR